MGSNKTFFWRASWKVKVTGMEPPSRVKSGLTLKTRSTALAAATNGQRITGLVEILACVRHYNKIHVLTIVGVLKAGDPRLAGVEALDLDSVLGSELGKLGVDVLDNAGVNLLGDHVGDRADRELANDLGGNDGLGASGRESSLNSVEGEGGVAPAALQGIDMVVVDGVLGIDGVVEGLQVEVQWGVGGLLGSCIQLRERNAKVRRLRRLLEASTSG